ncbi:thiamine phosphate synthase [Marinagarivorans algicola]|uniref:thiamine phosphate synthase n=1 Tax=Marinagarivorans algicola TaxID=1513270 RepID=UPI0006B43A78|nr:thiamine phosphate synthase [Marinagarivorans algicola]
MLYAITDSTLMPGELMLTKAQAALQGGCQWLQYRDKSTNQPLRLTQACALKSLCEQYNAKLIINDDLQLAIASQAHGLHLGQGDGSVQQARQCLGAHATIGVTCHDQLSLANTAIRDGASYVAFGRFFNSATKPDAKAAPLTLLNQARHLNVPVIAIGGITPDNSRRVIQAGASAIAVCHSLFACDNVKNRARDFCRAIST